MSELQGVLSYHTRLLKSLPDLGLRTKPGFAAADIRGTGQLHLAGQCSSRALSQIQHQSQGGSSVPGMCLPSMRPSQLLQLAPP